MTHAWHDAYRHAKTPAHHLDPRSKLLVGGLYMGCVLLSSRLTPGKEGAYAMVLFISALFCQVRVLTFMRRVGSLLPVILLMGLSAWLSRISKEHVVHIMVKAVLSIGAMTVLSAAVPFPDMLRALQELRVPRLFILFLAFLYRYGAVLGKETQKLERGWKAHYFGRVWRNHWRQLGHILSALLVRSYERAERVYAAMLARGFSLNAPAMHVLHFGVWDVVLVAVAGVMLGGIQWGRF